MITLLKFKNNNRIAATAADNNSCTSLAVDGDRQVITVK
jgi:hypothetical protein